MAISDDLFLALLAMDAYNRGYDRGLQVDGNQIGNATIGPEEGGESAQAVSFFAQSYIWNGQTVISYRGTDSGWDALYGWPTGIGGYANPQATLAAQFYQQVVGKSQPSSLFLT